MTRHEEFFDLATIIPSIDCRETDNICPQCDGAGWVVEPCSWAEPEMKWEVNMGYPVSETRVHPFEFYDDDDCDLEFQRDGIRCHKVICARCNGSGNVDL